MRLDCVEESAMLRHVDEPAQQSWFLTALGEVAAFAGRLVKNFVKALIAAQTFAVILGISVFVGAMNLAIWKGALAGVLIWLAAAGAGFFLSGNLAVVLSLAQTVRAKELAKKALDALFGQLLGVTPEKPEGDFELTKKFHGMPVDEVRTRLRAAGRALLRTRVATHVPGIGRWLLRKAQAVLVWATVWAVTAYATEKANPEKRVDLLALRGSLTVLIDDIVTEKITLGAIRLALLVALGAAGIGWLVVTSLIRFS